VRLTCTAFIIPAALFSAICVFTRWLHKDKHLPLTALDWLLSTPPCVPLDFDIFVTPKSDWVFQGSYICPSQADSLEPASQVIPNSSSIVDWKQKKVISSQHHLVNLMKVDVREPLLDSISEFDQVCMASVLLQL
jgi:hypothetical protein